MTHHYYAVYASAAAIALLATTSQAFSQDARSRSPPPPSTVLLLDVYNILGHTAFGLPASSLISRAAAWRDGRDGSEPIACVVDHGSARCAQRGGPLADRVGVLFAGPSLTADDVIVSLVKERCLGGVGEEYDDDDDVKDSTASSSTHRNTTVVVTADANLISRCQRQKREGSGRGGSGSSNGWSGASKSDLVFVEPASFLRELEKHSYADNDLFSGLSFDFPESVAGTNTDTDPKENPEKAASENNKAGSELDDTVSRLAGGDHNVRVENTAAMLDNTITNGEEEGEEETEDIIDAFMKETAVERTLNARSRLVTDFNAKTKKNGRSKSGGRNRISNRQRNKLIAKQRRARKHSENKIAQTARKDQAEKLRENLLAAGAEQANEAPVRTLLRWLAVPMDISDIGFDESSRLSDASDTLLRWSAGSDNNGKDPLAALMHVPRRQKGPVAPDEMSPRPLRAVVISDTHGFEAALAKMPNPEAPIPKGVETNENSHYLLPEADVLIHCGDFAANGSRMRQRESIRKLDSFLCAQKHIKHKIVVRGNHDPDTPGRVLFKKSKALYATSPLGLKIDGIKFALQPFSRRAHTTIPQTLQNLANADVLISHEPPKGVLDLTYSGMRVGSQVLRHAVETSKTKPRCWLCGHIHEGRGASREVFVPNGSKCDDSTLVINAANANVGKAHRLVSGAVLLDIDRESELKDEGDDTATFDSIVAKMPLEAKDLGLKAANVRPGVRRRKGLGNLRNKK